MSTPPEQTQADLLSKRNEMMTHHTSGPWGVEYHGDGSMTDKPTVAHVGEWRVVRDGRASRVYDLHGEDENDARLISAAPDLLAGCKALVAMLEHSMAGMRDREGVVFKPGISEVDLKPDGSIKLSEVRAAIAKAEGR